MTHRKSPPSFSFYLSHKMFTTHPTMCYVKKLNLFFAFLLYNSNSPNPPFDLAHCIYITQPTYVCVCLRILTSTIQYLKCLNLKCEFDQAHVHQTQKKCTHVWTVFIVFFLFYEHVQILYIHNAFISYIQFFYSFSST